MASKTKKQLANGLISHFLKNYDARYGKKPPRFNRYAVVAGFEAMVEDYGYEDGKNIIDFYFTLSIPLHPPTKLVYNYGEYKEDMDMFAKDEADRAEMRRRTEQQVLEARKKRGIEGSGVN